MRPGSTRTLRTAVAVLALCVYATLPLVGVIADLRHGVYHAMEALDRLEAKAAAYGLVHAHDESRPTGSARPGAYVHTHGGSTHTHDAGTDALLRAADAADDAGEEGVAPTPVKLAVHVPAVGQRPRLGDRTRVRPPAVLAWPADVLPAPPLVPPPRA